MVAPPPLREMCSDCSWTITAEFLEAEYHFYGALARTAAADSAIPDERQELLANAARSHQRLLEWAANCPDNFDSRAALVGAELARVEGRELDAERLYEQTIRSARTNGFVHIEALANELAGRFYGARGFETSATAYLKEARHCYLRWGADGKVRQLDQHYPHLFPQERVSDSRSAISEHIERLELETVLKGLRAVSGEIVLERVIETLLRMAIEHAGADRGVLLLTSGAGLLMQAEATVDATGVRVQLRERPVSADDLAESVVQYVARAQDTVILDDASTSDRFSTDVIHPPGARALHPVPATDEAGPAGSRALPGKPSGARCVYARAHCGAAGARAAGGHVAGEQPLVSGARAARSEDPPAGRRQHRRCRHHAR